MNIFFRLTACLVLIFVLGCGRNPFISFPPLAPSVRPILGMLTSETRNITRIGFFVKQDTGAFHPGIDWTTSPSLETQMRFVSAADGLVTQVVTGNNPAPGGGTFPRVNIIIIVNSAYSLEYIFEPYAAVNVDNQLAAIAVQPGQIVRKGDLLGTLIVSSEGSHVHFSLRSGNTFLCPYSFFEPSVRELLDQYALAQGSQVCERESYGE